MVSSRKLSSEEVDALIEGLQSDENGSPLSSDVSEAANVRPYKFGSDELSLLEIIMLLGLLMKDLLDKLEVFFFRCLEYFHEYPLSPQK